MSDELPPLPEPATWITTGMLAYDDEQMQAYARTVQAAERAKHVAPTDWNAAIDTAIEILDEEGLSGKAHVLERLKELKRANPPVQTTDWHGDTLGYRDNKATFAGDTPVQPTEPVASEPVDKCGFCGSPRYAHPPVQAEPVAWMHSGGATLTASQLAACDALTRKLWADATPLYAHPPVAPVASESAAFDLLVRTKVAIENSPGYFNKRMQEFVCLLQEWIDYAHPPVAPAFDRDFGQFAREDVLRWIDNELDNLELDDEVADALRWLKANLFGLRAVAPVASEPVTFEAWAKNHIPEGADVSVIMLCRRAWRAAVAPVASEPPAVDVTPLPWKVFNQNGVVEIQDMKGKAVIAWAGFDSSDRTKKANHANARFIVRACNAHPPVQPTEPFGWIRNGKFVQNPVRLMVGPLTLDWEIALYTAAPAQPTEKK